MYFKQLMQITYVLVLLWLQNKCYLLKTRQISLVEKFSCTSFYRKKCEARITLSRDVKEKIKRILQEKKRQRLETDILEEDT
jgi:hypothetical protein